MPIAGFQIDFLVHAPRQLTIAVEIKGWKKARGFRSRAAHFVQLLSDRIQVDAVIVVLVNLNRSSYKDGVVTLDALVPAIEGIVESPPIERKELKLPRFRPSTHIFAAMPFDPQYDDVFFVAMTHAAEKVGSVCKRVDQEDFAGDIVAEIERMIRTSQAVIVDLSDAKPNVLYEAGYAHALNKPVVHISSSPLSKLPFDVSHWNTLSYSAGRTHALRVPLTNRLRAAISGR